MPRSSGYPGKCSNIYIEMSSEQCLILITAPEALWVITAPGGSYLVVVTRGSRLALRESQRAFCVEPERRYDLHMSLITACNTTCAPAGLYYNEQFDTALSGPPTSISSYVIVCHWTALLSRQALMTG
jgi:hypothetical protein